MVDRPAELEAERALETPYDTSDPEQVSERRKGVGRREKRKHSAILKAMGDEDFRLWLYDLMQACHVYGNLKGDDSHGTYALIGERNIGILVMVELEDVCPELLVRMVSENRSRR